MSILSDITDFGKKVTGALGSWGLNPGSLIQAGASLLGGIQRNTSQQDQARAANEFSAQQFATRYQTTVKDMEAAGLNPMLAYSQGASGQPSGQQAVMTDYFSPAVSAYQNSNQQLLQEAQAEQARSSASLNARQERLVNATVDKTVQEISNLKANEDQVRALVDNLYYQQKNLIQEGENLKVQETVLRNTAQKILHETDLIDNQGMKVETENSLLKLEKQLRSLEIKLKGMDVSAGEKFDNLGRDYKQVAPIIDLLKSLIWRK
jgi:hypothetical protein